MLTCISMGRADAMGTRERILASSKELFATAGYQGTPIRDIAKHAKVNSALIRYHFGSKQGLLEAIARELLDEGASHLSALLRRKCETREEFRATLSLYLDVLITKGLERWQTIRIVVREAHELAQIKSLDFSQSSFSTVIALGRFIAATQRKGWILAEFDPVIAADNLMSLAIDQVLNWKNNVATQHSDISEARFRQKWIQQTLSAYLSGMFARD